MSNYSTQQEMQRRIRNKLTARSPNLTSTSVVSTDSHRSKKQVKFTNSQVMCEELVAMPTVYMDERYVTMQPHMTAQSARLQRSNGDRISHVSQRSVEAMLKYRNPNAHESKV